MAQRRWFWSKPWQHVLQWLSRSPQTRRTLAFALQGLLLFIGLWAALVLRLPGEYSELEVGRPSPFQIDAPTETEFVSTIRTNERMARAENRPENIVYQTDRDIPSQQRTQLEELLFTISSVRNDPTLGDEQKVAALTSLPSATVEIPPHIAEAIIGFDDTAWTNVRTFALSLYDRSMAEFEYAIDEQALRQLRDLSLPYWSTTRSLTELQRETVLLFVNAFLRVNVTLDEEATAANKQRARDEVEPVILNVQRGENIVRVGEIVTPETIEKLQATGAIPQNLGWAGIVGRGMLAGIFALGFMLYLAYFQSEVVRKLRAVMVIVLVLITSALIMRLVLPLLAAVPFAFPLATVALVLAVVFNPQLALAGVLLLAALIGLVEINFALALTLFSGSVAAVFLVRGAERLLTFLVAGVGVMVATVLTWIALMLEMNLIITLDQLVTEVVQVLFFSGINGLLSAIFALGLFSLLGQAAGVVTPLQLMELAHPNQPLLRKLVREAPGTYYHSVAVGNLAEAAAEAVGADALMLRVAALYHDIGKTIRPYFFTDNQMGRENVHNDLDPSTSAQIIVDHVREGIKMAEAAGLPEPIIGFIATHHGTHMIRHFYQLALQQEDSVDPNDYRYPGPRPATREQGILMLADSVEATVRSKAQNGKLLPGTHAGPGNGSRSNGSDVSTIDDLVGSIIDDRLRDGQLDNTPLTMHDLQQIRKTFVINLQSIYHPRVDYAPQVVRAS